MTDQPTNASPGPGPDPGAEPGLPPTYVAGPATRRPRRALAAAVAVLAVGAGAFGVLALSSGDGADSPEAAVEAMFDAIDQEDVIGVLEALDPTERAILRPAVEQTEEQAERVEVAAKDLDLRKVQGVDLQVEGLTYTTEVLGDGYTAVDLTGGTVSSSADLDRMAVGATVQALLDRDDAQRGGTADRSARDTIELDGVRLVARRSGGGWHVSALYSLAEQVRRTDHPGSEPPAFGRGIAAVGAASPEAVVREALDATIRNDVNRLIELTPPGEMAVLHDYGSFLVQTAGERDDDPGLVVSELELSTTDGPDGTKVVSASSFEAELKAGYGTTTWSYDGTCTTITEAYEDDWFAEAPNNGVILSGPGTVEDPRTYEQCDDDTGLAQGSMFFWSYVGGGPGGHLKVVVEEVDGAWFLSPSRSLIESTIGQLRSLSADDVRTAARIWGGELWLLEPDGFWAACGVERPAESASSEEGEAAAERCYGDLPDDYAGSSFYGYGFGYGYESIGEEITYEDDPSLACYEQGDDGVTEACLQELVETGQVPASALVAFRCSDVYAALDEDPDASEEAWVAADDAYAACIEAADLGSPPTAPTATTVPVPGSATTAVATVPTTTAAPAPTAPTTAVPATTVPVTVAPSTTVPG